MKRTLLLVLAVASVAGFATGMLGGVVSAHMAARPVVAVASFLCSDTVIGGDEAVRSALCAGTADDARFRAAVGELMAKGADDAQIGAFVARAKAARVAGK